MLLGKEDSFKENINIKINKKTEEEKNNEVISGKNNKNLNVNKFSINNNYRFDSSFFKNNYDKFHNEFSSKKSYVNCKNNIYFSNMVQKNTTTDISNLNNIQVNLDKCNNNKKIFCKCSKSGCKLKYCECFKAKQECTDLCRCFNCRNSKNPKMIFNNKHNEIFTVNSIYIINNIIFEEEKKKNSKDNFLNKKRKKSQSHKNIINNKGKKNLFVNKKNKLFDENGKMNFKHSKLSHFKKYQNICFLK